MLQKSGYLLHAVLALACHHTDHSSLRRNGRDQLSETALNHGQIALQLFRQALDGDNVAQIATSLLDTIITLFSLDVSCLVPFPCAGQRLSWLAGSVLPPW